MTQMTLSECCNESIKYVFQYANTGLRPSSLKNQRGEFCKRFTVLNTNKQLDACWSHTINTVVQCPHTGLYKQVQNTHHIKFDR